MLISGLIGLILGLFLPAIASRFGKVLPADPGMVLINLYHKPHFPFSPNVARRRLLRQKWRKLILNSTLWGGILSLLYCGCYQLLVPSIMIFGMIYCTIICYCIVIDAQYFLLPDFFTLPLLLIGFLTALCVNYLPIETSLMGALFGYIVSMVSVFIVGIFHKTEFGAGDVKMVTALGAWFGILGLNFALLLSFMFFAIQSTFTSKRQGAFGPSLGLAAIITFFIVYTK